MGAQLEFFAFRALPDVAALQACSWLTGFRLFERTSLKGWFLEGVSEDEAITFFEPLEVKDMPKALEADAEAWVRRAREAVAGLKKRSLHFRKRDLAFALTLSTVVAEPLFYAFGDDEGTDCSFVCHGGRLLRSRSEVSEHAALLIDSQDVSLEPLAGDGFLSQIVGEELQRFLGLDELWLPTSDQFDIDQTWFREIARKGAPAVPAMPPSAVDEIDNRPVDATVFAQFLEIADRWQQLALDPKFADAPRLERDPVETALSQCQLYAHRYATLFLDYRPDAFCEVSDHLLSVVNYVRLLRPKPEFRRAVDFARMREELARRWQVLKGTV